MGAVSLPTTKTYACLRAARTAARKLPIISTRPRTASVPATMPIIDACRTASARRYDALMARRTRSAVGEGEGGELVPGVASAAATAAADALLKRPLGGPLHSLVIAGEIHSVEAELLDTFR